MGMDLDAPFLVNHCALNIAKLCSAPAHLALLCLERRHLHGHQDRHSIRFYSFLLAQQG